MAFNFKGVGWGMGDRSKGEFGRSVLIVQQVHDKKILESGLCL